MAGRTVTLKVRYGDFTTVTRSRTLAAPTADAATVAALAVDLLAATEAARRPVRLLGVTVSNLDDGGVWQLPLFEELAGGPSAVSGETKGRGTGGSAGRGHPEETVVLCLKAIKLAGGRQELDACRPSRSTRPLPGPRGAWCLPRRLSPSCWSSSPACRPSPATSFTATAVSATACASLRRRRPLPG